MRQPGEFGEEDLEDGRGQDGAFVQAEAGDW